MRHLIPAFLLLIWSHCLPAVTLPELVLDGRKYTGVTVTLVSPSQAKLVHSSGIRTVDAALLPETVRQQLGYDPAAAEAHLKAAADAARAAAEKAAAGPPPKPQPVWLWVIENRRDGLVLGHFDIRYESTGSTTSRTGGGGASGTFQVRTKNHRMAWLPHNAATRQMAVGDAMHAEVSANGTHRIDEVTVVPAYRWHGIVKDKPAAK